MDTAPNNDQLLVARIRRGDKAAFDLVYARHWLRLYRVASKIVSDKVAAQDIIQDTFISLWEKGCHSNILNLEAYLYQTVKFRCFMHLRAGSISQRHLEHFAAIASGTIVETDVESRELEELLKNEITSLPERCREVFVLSRFEELPNKEIAAKLHISAKTVENQISKALKHLRFSLNKLAFLIVSILLG